MSGVRGFLMYYCVALLLGCHSGTDWSNCKWPETFNFYFDTDGDFGVSGKCRGQGHSSPSLALTSSLVINVWSDRVWGVNVTEGLFEYGAQKSCSISICCSYGDLLRSRLSKPLNCACWWWVAVVSFCPPFLYVDAFVKIWAGLDHDWSNVQFLSGRKCSLVTEYLTMCAQS